MAEQRRLTEGESLGIGRAWRAVLGRSEALRTLDRHVPVPIPRDPAHWVRMDVNRCISDAGSSRVQQYSDGWPHDVFGPSLCRSIVPAPQRILPASCLPDCQGFVLTSPLLLLTSSSFSSSAIAAPHLSRPTVRAPHRSGICHQRCLGPDLLSICNTTMHLRQRKAPVACQRLPAHCFFHSSQTSASRPGRCPIRVDLLGPHKPTPFSALQR
jgi:hypothetical protein